MGNNKSHTKKGDNVTSKKNTERRKRLIEASTSIPSTSIPSTSSPSPILQSDDYGTDDEETQYAQSSPPPTPSVLEIYSRQKAETSEDENYQQPISHLPHHIRRNKVKPRLFGIDFLNYDLANADEWEHGTVAEAFGTDSKVKVTYNTSTSATIESHTDNENEEDEDENEDDENENEEDENEKGENDEAEIDEDVIPEAFNLSSGDGVATLSTPEGLNYTNAIIMSSTTTSTKSKSSKSSKGLILPKNEYSPKYPVRPPTPATKRAHKKTAQSSKKTKKHKESCDHEPKLTKSAPVSCVSSSKNVPTRQNVSCSTHMQPKCPPPPKRQNISYSTHKQPKCPPPLNKSNQMTNSTAENDKNAHNDKALDSNSLTSINRCDEKKSRNVARIGAGALVRRGCCNSRYGTAPPVYIPSSGCGEEPWSGGRKTRNPLDRLRNVDVIESLCYYPPKDEVGCGRGGAMDMYSVCDDCGGVDYLGEKKEKKVSRQNPVTYTRKQRFNFKNPSDDLPRISAFPPQDGPPFVWQSVANPRAPPHRVCSFDELPVGKNPGPNCENLKKIFRGKSGNYVYDAKTCCLRRKEDVDAEKMQIVIEDDVNEDGSQVTPCGLNLQGQQSPCPQGVTMSCNGQVLPTQMFPECSGPGVIEMEEKYEPGPEKALCEMLMKMLANCMGANNNNGNTNGNWNPCNPNGNQLNFNPAMGMMGMMPGFGNGMCGPCSPFNGMPQCCMMPPPSLNNCQAYNPPKKNKKHKRREARTAKKDSESTIDKYEYDEIVVEDSDNNEYEMIEVIEED